MTFSRLPLALVLMVAFSAASSLLFAQDVKQLDAFIQSTVNEFDLPSLSIEVVKKGEVLFNKGYGERSKAAAVKPDQHTLYAIASLSKAFTAASIGMLVDEGKLKWQDKVVDHLPWFEMNDPYVTANMTIEDLLSHRSGLITFDGDLLWYGSSYSREEVIKRIRHRPLTHGFRSTFGYQNIMFMTAGEVIEAVSGITWDEFVQKRILNPLEMKRTTSSFKAFSTDANMAKPMIDGEEILMLSYDNCGATAALNSSTGDMGKWLRFWLNKGIVNGDTLLQERTIEKIWSMHTPLSVGNFDKRNGSQFKGYAQGWFLLDYNGKKVVHHGGGLPGYISKAVLVPEDELGMIILTNDMSSVPTMLMYAIMDWQAGKDLEPWKERFLQYKVNAANGAKEQQEKREAAAKNDGEMLALDAYMGTYEDEMYGQAKIKMGKDGLSISLLPTKTLFSGDMEPYGDHAFRFEFFDPFLPFGVATFEVVEGKVIGFRIDLPNNDFHFDKLDFKAVK